MGKESNFDKYLSIINHPESTTARDVYDAVHLVFDSSSETSMTSSEMLYLSQTFVPPKGKCCAIWIEFLRGALREAVEKRGITTANTKPLIVAGPTEPISQLILNGRTFNIQQRNIHKSHQGKMLYHLRDLKPHPKPITGKWLHHTRGVIDVEIVSFRLVQQIDGFILNDLEGQIIDPNAKAHHGYNRKKKRGTETLSENSFRASEATWSELFTALNRLSFELEKPIFLRPDFVAKGIEKGRIFDDQNGRVLQKPPDKDIEEGISAHQEELGE